jgi:3-oxoacyl-[acyl-carrier protein] reductase
MHNKNIIIIGGTKGIGRATAELLNSQGARVTVIARNQPGKALPEGINLILKDVVNDEIDEEDIPEVIDGLVYCPGTINLKPFKSISEQQYLDEFQINALGAVKVIKSALKGLKKSTSSPGIVLFSTVAVTQGMPFHASIAMAKGAVEGLTRSLAAELAPSVRVNCIAPSLTDTSLAEKLLASPERADAAAGRHPLKRIGNADEMAAMVRFLLSEEAGWISGQIVHVDGGLSSLRV